MIVVVHSGSINFRKTGTIRTRGVLSKKDEKKVLAFFLVLLPLSLSARFSGYNSYITWSIAMSKAAAVFK